SFLSTTSSPALITYSVLCIPPESIYLWRLFTSSLLLSALYHIIDQSILGGSGGERERAGKGKQSGEQRQAVDNQLRWFQK
uniref:Uncharacterized protein n=1 Tax=Urocitellus parryii TaxID=9999 RepID=A0A8D2HG00_UROPR